MTSIALAAKIISSEVNKAGLAGILGLAGSTNVQDEEVKKLDVFANDVLVQTLAASGHVCVMGSEEVAEPIAVDDPRSGKYVVVFDPLDGSSNIDANVSIGTIFGVYSRTSDGDGPGGAGDLLQPGHRQVAAGYVIYGSSTMFVYTAGAEVAGFTLDPAIGEFLCSHPRIRTPRKGKIYSCNEANSRYWDPKINRWLEHVKSSGVASSRYIGSLVADFHRNLLYGGIFLYPADSKDAKKPHGKLRLLYEANPLALIAERAGGAASSGTGRILDIEPTDLHQRVPLFLGSADDVAEVESFLAATGRKEG
jgi:fructose-1,6-bisphosphatase I